MIDLLDEISEIPFEVFWDKWHELKPSICNRERAEKEWFFMHENDRVSAFSALAKNHAMIQIINEPSDFLIHFSLPF